MFKNKKLLGILLAIALIVVFMVVRTTSDAGKELTDSIISDVLGVETDSVEDNASGEEAQYENLPAEGAGEEDEEPDAAGDDNAPAEGLAEEDGELPAASEENTISEDGVYDSKDEVALYIHLYGHLPSNYITKDEAKAQGWSGSGSDKLDNYCPGKCIGGDSFGNREGLLPKASGRKYTECDIDTLGAKQRGTKRIVFSNDGLIYYTEDHYTTFTLLYGEP